MKKSILSLVIILLSSLGKAQELPLKITVPPISDNPNISFNVLNFEILDRDKFSILYVQHIQGSIMHEGEFVRDTGDVVYKDAKFTEMIPASNTAFLVKKQVLDASGKVLETKEELISARALDQDGAFTLCFRKGFKHPMVPNKTLLKQSIYNIQGMQGFSSNEWNALVEMSRPYIPVKQGEVTGSAQVTPAKNDQMAQDIMAMKSQFRSLREVGVMAKGNLPDDEKILTRNGISDTRMFVITKTKGKTPLLKFYVSEDLKNYDLLDTLRIFGDIELTSACAIFNTKNEVVGAYNNCLYKYKDEKGDELSRQYTFVMDQDYKIQKWIYSVGKDKLNSVYPEICWYEGKDLFVLSSNRERVFKTPMQVHKLVEGKEAELLYPKTEEERGSEKTAYMKNFQPAPPSTSSQIAPIPSKYTSLYMCKAGDVKYFVMQGTKYDDVAKATRYLSVQIYRVEGNGKLTSIDILSDYNELIPFPMATLVKNKGAEYYLLAYPIRVQMIIKPEKCEIQPLTADNTTLIPLIDKSYIHNHKEGAVMLKRSLAGSQYTLMYYPQD